MLVPKIFLRCDFGPKYGLGHLMRCLALAEALQRRFHVRPTLLTNHFDKQYWALLRQYPVDVQVFPEPVVGLNYNISDYVGDGVPTVTIFDNYDVTLRQMLLFRSKQHKLVAIDDVAERDFAVDLLVNPNLCAEQLDYSSSHCPKLLGHRYVMLRDKLNTALDFLKPLRKLSRRTCIFMSFGAGNVYTRIRPLLMALCEIDRQLKQFVQVDFVLPSDERERAAIIRDCKPCRHLRFNYIIDCYDLTKYMRKANFAITAAGSTVYELAYYKVPQLVYIIADNQRQTAQHVEQHGLGYVLGSCDSLELASVKAKFMNLLENETVAMAQPIVIDDLGKKRIADRIALLA